MNLWMPNVQDGNGFQRFWTVPPRRRLVRNPAGWRGLIESSRTIPSIPAPFLAHHKSLSVCLTTQARSLPCCSGALERSLSLPSCTPLCDVFLVFYLQSSPSASSSSGRRSLAAQRAAAAAAPRQKTARQQQAHPHHRPSQSRSLTRASRRPRRTGPPCPAVQRAEPCGCSRARGR